MLHHRFEDFCKILDNSARLSTKSQKNNVVLLSFFRLLIAI